MASTATILLSCLLLLQFPCQLDCTDIQYSIPTNEDQQNDSTKGRREPALSTRPILRSTPSIVASSSSLPMSGQEQAFLDWCKNVLGIRTLLEIRTFEYYDYMKALPTEDWDEGLTDDEQVRGVPVDSLPMVPVRGLAATRDIQQGETVIQIPLQALLSVTTTIDKDPVLGPIMGPEARKRRGWDAETGGGSSGDDDGTSNTLAASMLEIPLLAVAVLHHKRLGGASPIASYIQILDGTPVDSFPFLWEPAKLKSDVSEGIRTVARGIKREMKDMYTSVVQVLVEERPDLFGRPEQGGEWMFSFEKFQWAFAIVNSRHWQLPISDLETPTQQQPQLQRRREQEQDGPTHPKSAVLEDEQLPPADMPTDAWVRSEEGQEQRASKAIPQQEDYAISPHSFLAPVADLLNFGPPCTRGRYNQESHTFEIVASCSFLKGQEVTFWYSDECDHVMVGVYGFMHPIVPSCPSAEEYRRSGEEWRSRAKELERQLYEATQDLYQLDGELLRLRGILKSCGDCCHFDEKKESKTATRRSAGGGGTAAADDDDDDDEVEVASTKLRHEHVRGGGFGTDTEDHYDEDIARRGVRQMRRERNSEF